MKLMQIKTFSIFCLIYALTQSCASDPTDGILDEIKILRAQNDSLRNVLQDVTVQTIVFIDNYDGKSIKNNELKFNVVLSINTLDFIESVRYDVITSDEFNPDFWQEQMSTLKYSNKADLFDGILSESVYSISKGENYLYGFVEYNLFGNKKEMPFQIKFNNE